MQEQDKNCPNCEENEFLAKSNAEYFDHFFNDVRAIKRTLKTLTKILAIQAGFQKKVRKSREENTPVELIKFHKYEWDELNDYTEEK